jgi:hypothetical protein
MRMTEPFAPCKMGHMRHDRVADVTVILGGTREPPDPTIPEKFARKFVFTVFDVDVYGGSKQYCPGCEATNAGILYNGIWEPEQTLLTMHILDCGDRSGIVMDFGASVGWYSILAASFGYKVLSFEGNMETAMLLLRNAAQNRFTDKIHLIHSWIDDRFPIFSDHNGPIELIKMDVEGNEPHVYRVCRDMIENRDVHYCMMEVSPMFFPKGESPYVRIMEEIRGCGYKIFEIPDKTFTDKEILSNNPLDATHQREILDVGNYVSSIQQRNVLFEFISR